MPSVVLALPPGPSRDALKATLTQAAYACEPVNDAVGALEALVGGSPVALLCDPEAMGPELDRVIRMVRRKNVPLIILSASVSASNPDDKDAGGRLADVSARLPLTPDPKELLSILEMCAADHDAPAADQLSGEGHCKVPIADFMAAGTLPFDVFIRIGAGKYVKIAPKGEELSDERLKTYAARGARFLYLKQADFAGYLGLSVNTVQSAAAQSGGAPPEKRIQLVAHASDVILDHLNANRIDGKLFQAARTVVESSISMLATTADGYKILEILNSRQDVLYTHYVGVSFYAALIARQLKMAAPADLYKIAVGGLLHDIGAPEMENAPAKPGQPSYHDGHPEAGAQMLKEIAAMPEEVVRIILEHHEHPAGVGFPKGLNQDEIHPYARLVAMVDEFCQLILKTPGTTPLPIDEALDKMYRTRLQLAEHPYFGALVQLFKMKIDTQLGMVRPE